jgi:hypothetical protein
VQYKAIVDSIHQLAGKYDRSIEDMYVWLDFESITQMNNFTLQLCINSLPLYARSVSAFVIISPPVVHENTKAQLDLSTYQRRTWCRIEQFSHHVACGHENMYQLTGNNVLQHYPYEDVHNTAMFPFEAELTCCAMNHTRPDGSAMPCDKAKLFNPMLSLFAIVYLGRNRSPHYEQIYHTMKRHEKRIFPPTYTYSTRGRSITKPLFEDKIRRFEKYLDNLSQSEGSTSTKSDAKRQMVTTHNIDKLIGIVSALSERISVRSVRRPSACSKGTDELRAVKSSIA